jgi:AmmeMemoRadiSam system protein A
MHYNTLVALSSPTRVALLDLARTVIRHRLTSGFVTDPEITSPTDPAFLQRAGSFVSLHDLQTHRLRGCVGRLDTGITLFECIKHSASSVLKDPRFLDRPVTLDELPRLLIEISVISPLRPCTASDFDLETDGIYLTIGERSGCFLPQVARETGWTRPELLTRLCLEKLNLPADAWQDPNAQFQAFATELIGPEPFVP